MESYLAQRRANRGKVLSRVMLTALLCVLVGAPLGVWALRRFERAVVFHPERYRDGEVWKLPAGGEEVWFKAPSGERLHGWFIRARGDAPPAATILYLHGNGGNINNLGWLGELWSERGFDVLLFDYRGYGRSEGSATGERAVYEDADAAYDFLAREKRVPPERLVLYGQSLGTTAAADVASRRACAAVILESGLSSADEMAGVVLPFLPAPVRRLTKNRFESARKLANVRCPVLVAHGALDETIPVGQGRALYDAAREPKELIILPSAGHNDVVALGGEEYLRRVEAFIRRAVGGAGGAKAQAY